MTIGKSVYPMMQTLCANELCPPPVSVNDVFVVPHIRSL